MKRGVSIFAEARTLEYLRYATMVNVDWRLKTWYKNSNWQLELKLGIL